MTKAAVVEVANIVGVILGFSVIFLCFLFAILLVRYYIRKHNRKLTIEILMTCTWVVLLAYGCMLLSMHFSVDSFHIYYDIGAYYALSIGRYTGFCLNSLTNFLKINQTISQQYICLIFIISLIFSLFVISYSFIELIQDKSIVTNIFVTLAVCISIVNVFYMELVLFPEMALPLSVNNLFTAFSVHYAARSKHQIVYLLLNALFAFWIIGNYQAYVGILVIFWMTEFLIKYKQDPKKAFRNSVIYVSLAGALSILDVLITNLTIKYQITGDSGRGGEFDIQTISQNIIRLLQYNIDIWGNGAGIFNCPVMMILGIVLIYCSVISIINLNSNLHRLYLLILLVFGYFMAFAPHVIESNITLTPRSNIAFWTWVSCLFIIYFSICSEKRFKLHLFVTEAGLLFTILINLIIMPDMAANTSVTNAIDIEEAKQIVDRIDDYEKSTGTIIANIGIHNDFNRTYYYSESRYRVSQLGARIMATPYSNFEMISYFLGRHLNNVGMTDDQYITYFGDNEWDEFDPTEQIAIDGDTIYIAVY